MKIVNSATFAIKRLQTALCLIALYATLYANAVYAAGSATWELSRDKTALIINFNFDGPAASAAFYRGGYLWLVFDQSLSKLETKKLIGTSYISAVEQEERGKATILRLKPTTTHLRANKALNGWQLYLSKVKLLPQPYPASTFLPEPMLGQVSLKGGMPSQLLKLKDPVIGDEIAIALYYDEVAYKKNQTFIDFNTIAALQGAAFSLTSERTSLELADQAIVIHLPSKTEVMPKPVQEILEKQQSGSMLWFSEMWRKASDSSFVNDESMLWNQLHELPPSFRGQVLWLIAKLYFSHGLHAESGAVIQLMRALEPSYAGQPNINLTAAVARYWEEDLQEAYKEVEGALTYKLSPEAKTEINFWKKIIDSKLGETSGDNLTIDHAEYPFLKYYPDGLIVRIAEQVFNSWLGRPEAIALNGPKAIKLVAFHHPSLMQDPIIQLYGDIFGAFAGSEAALNALKKISQDSDEPKIRALSEFYYLQAGLATQKLNIVEALEELDKLQTVWREPKFEERLLRYYGELLIQNRELIKGLRTWRRLLRAFPDQKSNLPLLTQMSRLFVELITSSDGLSPFEAVAAYEEFKELTPVGPEADKVVRKVIGYLVELDLLDHAIELLSHQIQFRVDGKARAPYVNKLAEVYLINYEPLKALDVLDFYQEPDLSYELAEQRKYLFARVMIETGRVGYVMDLLQHDYSVAGGNIKANVLWLEGDWQNLRILLEPRILALQVSTVPLTPAQEIEILLLSVALAKLDDGEEIKALYKQFYPRIASNRAIGEMLKFLAWQYLPLDYRHLDKSLGIEGIKRLLEHKNEIYQPVNL